MSDKCGGATPALGYGLGYDITSSSWPDVQQRTHAIAVMSPRNGSLDHLDNLRSLCAEHDNRCSLPDMLHP
jgi:hypothetical protein